jgi:hypothetical protein
MSIFFPCLQSDLTVIGTSSIIRNHMAYVPVFQIGSHIRIANEQTLNRFERPQYKKHHPVTPEHLKHAGESHLVKSIGMYHGGDQLYVLDGIPGISWHEECLLPDQP